MSWEREEGESGASCEANSRSSRRGKSPSACRYRKRHSTTRKQPKTDSKTRRRPKADRKTRKELKPEFREL